MELREKIACRAFQDHDWDERDPCDAKQFNPANEKPTKEHAWKICRKCGALWV